MLKKIFIEIFQNHGELSQPKKIWGSWGSKVFVGPSPLPQRWKSNEGTNDLSCCHQGVIEEIIPQICIPTVSVVCWHVFLKGIIRLDAEHVRRFTFRKRQVSTCAWQDNNVYIYMCVYVCTNTFIKSHTIIYNIMYSYNIYLYIFIFIYSMYIYIKMHTLIYLRTLTPCSFPMKNHPSAQNESWVKRHFHSQGHYCTELWQ